VNRKAIATDSSPDRDQQFRYISSLRTRFERQGLPIISVDTKKRELVGNFKNHGVKWDRTPVRVNDHDFRSDAIGVAIPYGIYDLLANRGSVFVGVSHDTAAFAAHSIAGWWKRDGADRYRRGRQLLILADTGGSNSCRTGACAFLTRIRNTPSDLGGLEVLFRQIVLPLASSAIDHRNPIGLGPAPDSPAESAGQAHPMGVVQGIHGAGQILPPDPETSGIVLRAEVAIQNDSIYAVVAARQQIPVKFTQSICHRQKIQEPALRVQLSASGYLDS
jgi:hypothetical protein